ncbi:MAG: OadG family protein [Treponema sp.]|jgi:oxaloacetate decarboxylase gamma subunit|nr:OadG family protein [Treponema sp.]
MTILEMLQQSAVLTLLGMTVVFLFLWLMIICVNVVGKLVHKMGWDKDVYPQSNRTPKNASGTVKPEITAAITGAVTEYKKKDRVGHEYGVHHLLGSIDCLGYCPRGSL